MAGALVGDGPEGARDEGLVNYNLMIPVVVDSEESEAEASMEIPEDPKGGEVEGSEGGRSRHRELALGEPPRRHGWTPLGKLVRLDLEGSGA